MLDLVCCDLENCSKHSHSVNAKNLNIEKKFIVNKIPSARDNIFVVGVKQDTTSSGDFPLLVTSE